MKKYIYAAVDNLAGFIIGLELSTDEPELFVENKNRQNLMQPMPFCKTTEFRLIGELDDVTLEGEMYAIKTIVGDYKESVAKLEAYANANKPQAN